MPCDGRCGRTARSVRWTRPGTARLVRGAPEPSPDGCGTDARPCADRRIPRRGRPSPAGAQPWCRRRATAGAVVRRPCCRRTRPPSTGKVGLRRRMSLRTVSSRAWPARTRPRASANTLEISARPGPGSSTTICIPRACNASPARMARPEPNTFPAAGRPRRSSSASMKPRW